MSLLIETYLMIVFMTLLNLAVGRCFYAVDRFRSTLTHCRHCCGVFLKYILPGLLTLR